MSDLWPIERVPEVLINPAVMLPSSGQQTTPETLQKTAETFHSNNYHEYHVIVHIDLQSIGLLISTCLFCIVSPLLGDFIMKSW